MFYLILLALFSSLVSIFMHSNKKLENNERIETMDTLRDLHWLKDVKNELTQRKPAPVLREKPNIIEWQLIEGKSPLLNHAIKEAKAILIKTYAEAELEFAKAFPQSVPKEMFLKPLAPLFERGLEHVDWLAAHDKIKTVLEQFFDQTDFANFSGDNDLTIIVEAKDAKTKVLLGIIQFMITPSYEHGSIRVGLFGVKEGEKINVEKLLMSSIFTLIPSTKRLFLHVRRTNQSAIHTYISWGFYEFEGPLPHWIDLQYLSEQSDQLQKTASLS